MVKCKRELCVGEKHIGTKEVCNQNKALSFLIILSMLKFEVTANYTSFIIALMSPTFFSGQNP